MLSAKEYLTLQGIWNLHKNWFYQVYDGELRKIADEDELHPADAEEGLSIFAMFLVLVIIAAILYFSVIRSLIS